MQSEHYIMDLNKGNEQKNKVVKKKRPANCRTLLLSLLDLNQGPSD